MQVVSKKRVRDHAEVYTNQKDVHAVLDLFNEGRINYDDRCLEPACGLGVFIDAIIFRKLKRVAELKGASGAGLLCNALVAISSTYGVEILQENVDNCVKRLHAMIVGSEFLKDFRKNEKFSKLVFLILKTNIICCDFLTGKTSDGKDATFVEWRFDAINLFCTRSTHSFYEIFVRNSFESNTYGSLGLSFVEHAPVSIWDLK